MSRILQLAPEVSGKIAAGEVIERPSSVIKELIENSIDASSRRISVAVEDGGRTLARVVDDGDGIPYEELPLAVMNFSTSKIRGIDDITNVLTLGFRGEALASIRAVCNLTIRTRARTEDVGREMQWRAAELLTDTPHVRNPGTEITVTNLFFNLPARKKFLASASSELRRITALVQSYALPFPDIQFTLRENGRDILACAASTADERIEAVFGADVFAQLKHFDNRIGSLHITGYASAPHMTRPNRSYQFIFVNRRLVRDKLITHAVHQAYQSLIPAGRFPLIVLFVDAAPNEIDVNVHPTKSEVRFANEREVHRIVSSTLRDAFRQAEHSFSERVRSAYRSIFPKGAGLAGERERTEGGYATHDERNHSIMETETALGRRDTIFRDAPLSLFGEQEEESIVPTGNLYWQLHQSFILIQIRGGMVVVDQHAAHERILFNKAKQTITGAQPVVQSLLFPATLEFSPEEYEKFELFENILPSLGFAVERFGQRSVIVRGIPAGVRNWNDGRLLQEILGEVGTGSSNVDDLLKGYACRSAVKAGTTLSLREMENLTDQLFATEFPFTCPHGRPTVLRVSLSDLERRFHRTVSTGK